LGQRKRGAGGEGEQTGLKVSSRLWTAIDLMHHLPDLKVLITRRLRARERTFEHASCMLHVHQLVDGLADEQQTNV
jgi:hypothetical protein